MPTASLRPAGRLRRALALRSALSLRGRSVSRGLERKHAERASLLAEMETALTHAQWADAARRYDLLTGRERWKARARTTLYDYAMIGEKLERLRELIARRDVRGLMFEIEEGIHGNLGGIGKAALYRRARFGTKDLIERYIESVVEALHQLRDAGDDKLPAHEKIDLFQRARHCYGRTALMMSCGGMLMFFHFGVAKALLEQGLLPEVISGSSAGAIVAAVLGTHTDAELQGFFTPENVYFGAAWHPSRLERMTGLRRLVGGDAFERTFDRLVPDLTFREAYEISGRHINISVSPCERHQTPRLLNATTSPHVLVRSAVRASCALPGLFEPVQLLARDVQGRTVPFLKSRWIDGIFAADLPARQLARFYGINHFVVSYANPVLLPTFRDHRIQSAALGPLVGMLKGTARNLLRSADGLVGRYASTSALGTVHKIARDLLSQDYVGDINITPQRRLFPPHRLLSPLTRDEIGELIREGERQTWPRIEMIRNSSRISRTLDELLSVRPTDATPQVEAGARAAESK